MSLLIKKALRSQSLTFKQSKHFISISRNAEYAGHWLYKAACHSLCIPSEIQHIVLNTDKYEWPQMVLATDVLTVVPMNCTLAFTMKVYSRFMMV